MADRLRDVNVTFQEDSVQLDLFNRLRTSEPSTLFSYKSISSKNHVINEKLTGAGTTTYNADESTVDLNVGTASGDKATRQSKNYITYLSGKPMQIKATGVFASPKTNVVQRIGYFDDENGLFFDVDGTSVGVVRRTNTSGSVVNNRVAQSSWNIDKMDGTGISGITLDFSKYQFYIIEFLWQGGVGVRWGVMVDHNIHYVHAYYAGNVDTVPFIGKPNLPVRYEIENTGIAGSATSLKEGCVDVVAEGGSKIIGSDWSMSNGITAVNVGTTEEVVLVARMKTTFGGETVRKLVKLLSTKFFADSQNTYVRVSIVHNPTSVTGGTWSDVDTTDSVIEYNTGQPTITGGDEHTIDEYYVPASGGGQGQAGTGGADNRFEDTHTVLSQDIAGTTSDLFVIYATALASTTDVYATMKILEFE